MRIARDLHDVVAHNISVINVQANTALHLMDRQPERARSALTTINDVSKQALVELRSVLGVLRAPTRAPAAPTPGLARLGDLIDNAAAAGLSVRVEEPDGGRGCRRRRSRRLPDPAGGPDQQRPPSGGRAPGAGRLPGGPCRSRSRMMAAPRPARAARLRPAPGTGSGDHRDDRAGGRARRHAAGGPLGRGRFPGPGRGGAAGPAGRGRAVIRVVLADDQELVRAGFGALLDAEDDIEVVGEAADGEQAVRLAGRARRTCC